MLESLTHQLLRGCSAEGGYLSSRVPRLLKHPELAGARFLEHPDLSGAPPLMHPDLSVHRTSQVPCPSVNLDAACVCLGEGSLKKEPEVLEMLWVS